MVAAESSRRKGKCRFARKNSLVENRLKSVPNLEIEQLPTESVLGMKQNIEQDKFVSEVSLRSYGIHRSLHHKSQVVTAAVV